LVQNKPMIYGYARVSTDGQSVTAQVAALRKHGAGKVFREVASGAKTDRAQLRRVLDELDAGDVLMVTRLDRLARSTRDLLTPSRRSPARKPVSSPLATHGRHHDCPWPFDVGRLWWPRRVRARSNARTHRRRTRPRQGACASSWAAKKMTEHQKREAIRRRDHYGEPVRDIARSYNVSHSTISRLTA
jgi:DNA invertase Pin-like site-specific DNA recombinase